MRTHMLSVVRVILGNGKVTWAQVNVSQALLIIGFIIHIIRGDRG